MTQPGKTARPTTGETSWRDSSNESLKKFPNKDFLTVYHKKSPGCRRGFLSAFQNNACFVIH
jgi:hypothetical protein